MAQRELRLSCKGHIFRYLTDDDDEPSSLHICDDTYFCNKCGQRLVEGQQVCPSCQANVSSVVDMQQVFRFMTDIACYAQNKLEEYEEQRARRIATLLVNVCIFISVTLFVFLAILLMCAYNRL